MIYGWIPYRHGQGTELAPALLDAIIIAKNLGNTNFFSFGIGSSVNRYLVDGIAKAGQGEAFVVTEPGEAKATADRFLTYIQSPVLNDIQVSETIPLESNSAIAYLWARTKVDRLMDYGAPKANSDAVKKEVTQLGLKYSMMTPYTSFIAVLDTIRNTTGDSKDVPQPLPLPEGVSDILIISFALLLQIPAQGVSLC